MLSLSSESFRYLHIIWTPDPERRVHEGTEYFVSPSVITDVSKEGPGNKAIIEVWRQRCDKTDVSKTVPFNNEHDLRLLLI